MIVEIIIIVIAVIALVMGLRKLIRPLPPWVGKYGDAYKKWKLEKDNEY